MVTPTNHVIAGLDLHCAGPLTLWGFSQDLSAKYRGRPKKKSYDLSAGPQSGTAPHYGKSSPGKCITFIKSLYEGLR